MCTFPLVPTHQGGGRALISQTSEFKPSWVHYFNDFKYIKVTAIIYIYSTFILPPLLSNLALCRINPMEHKDSWMELKILRSSH